MKEEPDSLSVPYNFARCFNAQCPQAPQMPAPHSYTT